MKKSIFKTSLFILLSGLVFLGIGCENFIEGSDVVKELEESIAYANSPSFTIHIAPSENIHGSVITGYEKTGIKASDKDSYDLEFQLNSDYVFLGWRAVKRSDKSVSLADCVQFQDFTQLKTTYKVIKANQDVLNGDLLILADCAKIATARISIQSEEGYVSYNSTEEYKTGTVLNLTFNAKEDYAFTHWQVSYGDPDSEDRIIDTSNSIITFKNDDYDAINTTAIFAHKPEDMTDGQTISITPICELRPVALSWSPQISQSGVFRDSRIIVRFDQEMAPESIYFTDAELSSMSGIESKADEKGRIYAYEKNGTLYYKNIKIINSDTKTSVLRNYGAPYFETPEVLIIPSQKGNNAIKSGSTVIVELTTGFFYKSKDNYTIPLRSKKWDYLVNSATDDVPPTLELGTTSSETAYMLPVLNADGSLNTAPTTNISSNSIGHKKSDDNAGTIQAETPSITDKTTADKYYLKDNKLYLAATVVDYGSQPDSFKMSITPYLNSKYSTPANTDPITKKMGLSGTGNTKYYGTKKQLGGTDYFIANEFDLSEENLADGIYKITFEAADSNGNTANFTNEYYVLLDKTGPETFVAGTSKDITSISVSVLKPDVTDYEKTTVYYNNDNSDTFVAFPTNKKITSAFETYTQTSLNKGTSYYFKVHSEDWFGNAYETPVKKLNTLPEDISPKLITINESDRTEVQNTTYTYASSDSPVIKWAIPSGNYAGAVVYYSTAAITDKKSDNVKSIKVPKNGTDKQGITISDFTPGATNHIIVCAYDDGDDFNSSNENNTLTTQCTAILRPAEIQNFSCSEIGEDYITVSWDKPAGDYDSIILTYKDQAASTPTTVTITKNDDDDKALSKKIDSLATNHLYDFTIKTQKTISSVLSSDESKITGVNTKASGVKNLKVTANSSTTVSLSWTNPSDLSTIAAHNIYYQDLSISNSVKTLYSTYTNKLSSATVSNLIPGHQYKFFVDVKATTGDTSNAAVVTQTIRPNQVTDLTLTRSTSSGNSISVSWNYSSTGISSGAVILVNTENEISTSNYVGAANSSTKSFTFNSYTNSSDSSKVSVTSGTCYYVWVISYSGQYPQSLAIRNNTSSITNWAVPTTSTCKSIYSKPEAPSALAVTATSINSITVSYTAPANYTGFNIYKKDLTANESSYTLVGSTTNNSAYTLSSLTSGHKYSIYVKTYAGAKDNESDACSAVTQYTRPRNITCSATRTPTSPKTSITYNWAWPEADSSNSQGITGIIVLYGTTNNITHNETKYKTWWKPSESNRSASIDGLQPNKTYYVWIYSYVGDSTMGNIATTIANDVKAGTARNDINCELSAKAIKTAPNAPTSFTATTVTTGGQIKLTWTAPTNGCDGYKLYYGTTSSPDTLAATLSSTATSYTFSGSSKKTYYFKLYSYNDTWVSTSSTNIGETSVVGPTVIRPKYPNNLGYSVPNTGADSDYTTLLLSWDNPTDYDYKYINYGTNSTNTLSSSIYKGWCYPAGNGGYENKISSLTQGTRYYIWLASSNGPNWANIITDDLAGNYNPTPIIAYTKPQVNKYVVHSSWNITSTSSGMKFDWQYVSDTTSRSKDYTYLSFWIGTSSDFTKAKKIDWWNYDQYSTTTTKTYASPASTTLSKNTTYYFWYTVTVGKNPSTVADITDANSYKSGYKSVKALY